MLRKTDFDGALICGVDATSSVLCAGTYSPSIQNRIVHESPPEAGEMSPGIVLRRD
jgi:hypothetical protein